MRKEPKDRLCHKSGGENNPFEEEMRRYQAAGVEITLKNVRLPLEDIARFCAVRERGTYMCDFVADEENYIVRINIDDIREEERRSDPLISPFESEEPLAD